MENLNVDFVSGGWFFCENENYLLQDHELKKLLEAGLEVSEKILPDDKIPQNYKLYSVASPSDHVSLPYWFVSIFIGDPESFDTYKF